MKVTALIPDDLMREVRQISKGENTTQAIIIALSEWISVRKLRTLTQSIKKDPLKFCPGFSASKVRESNRRK